MFYFISFASSLEFDECAGQNTLRLGNGTCVCLKNFPFGDPNSKDGCFKCTEECHEKATCVPPGKCKCIKGLIGDGKLRCDLPIPEIVEVYPRKVQKKGGDVISVNFTTETNYSAISGFCKFGKDLIVQGKIVNENTLNCVAPSSESTAQRFSISLDNVTYTEESIFIEFFDNSPKPMVQIVWQVWAAVLVFVIFAIIYFNMQKPKDGPERISSDERIAFARKSMKDPVVDIIEKNNELSMN